MNYAVIFVLSAMLVTGFIGSVGAVIDTYYFDDAPPAGSWGSTLPYWERMDAGPLPSCVSQDLDPANPYYGCSYPLTKNYSGYYFFASIWLANSNSGSSPVTVELRTGTWGVPDTGSALASVSVNVTNQIPSVMRYNLWFFYYSPIYYLVLDNKCLILKIVYPGQTGNTRIYWDGEGCPSALYATNEWFIRGDANWDSTVDGSDPIFTINYLFMPGSPPVQCIDAADVNDDGEVDGSDPVFVINYLFVPGSLPIPPPFPN